MAADPVEIRRNDDGSIDEVVGSDCNIAIEQMDDDLWSVFIAKGGREWIFQFTREGKAIVLTCVDYDGS